LPALCLRQDIVDLIGNRVALGLETHRCETQYGPEHRPQCDEGEQGGQQRVLTDQFLHSGLHKPRESHEGQRHQAGCYHANSSPFEGDGNVCHCQTLAHRRKKHQHQ